jgi:hypothetical protein
MILLMSVVGYDITSFFTSPLQLTVSIIFLVVLYFFSKWYQKYINRKLEK